MSSQDTCHSIGRAKQIGMKLAKIGGVLYPVKVFEPTPVMVDDARRPARISGWQYNQLLQNVELK